MDKNTDNDEAFIVSTLSTISTSPSTSSLAASLSSLRSALSSSPSASSLFIARHYQTFIIMLFTQLIPRFKNSPSPLSASSYSFFFSPFFPSHVVFPSLLQAAATGEMDSAAGVEEWRGQRGIRRGLEECALRPAPSPSSPPVLSAPSLLFLDSLVSAPAVWANKWNRKTPKQYQEREWHKMVMEELYQYMSTCLASTSSTSSSTVSSECGALLAIVGQYDSKLCRTGHARILVDHLSPIWRTALANGKPWSNELIIYREAIYSLHIQAVEPLLIEILKQEAPMPANFFSWLLDPLYIADPSSPSPDSDPSTPASPPSEGAAPHAQAPGGSATGQLIKAFFSHKCIFVKQFPLPVMSTLISYFFTLSYCSSPPSITPLSSVADLLLSSLANTWSTSSFIQHTPHDQQSYITAILLSLLSQYIAYQAQWLAHQGVDLEALQLRAQQGDDDEPFFGPFSHNESLLQLMTGVQHRLTNPIRPIRLAAMRVAMEFSKLLDPRRPLDFQQEMEEDEGAVLAQAEADNIKNNAPNRRVVTTADSVESDYQGTAAAASSIFNAAVHNTPFHAANANDDDDSDLRKVPLPAYLRDLLDYLHKPDSRDHMESALLVGEQLIRHRPADLEHVSAELAGLLMQIATSGQFVEESWNIQRLKALLALIVMAPTHTVPYLIGQFHSLNVTIKAKLDILDTLVGAASEMSEIKRPPTVSDAGAPSGSAASAGGRRLVEETRTLPAVVSAAGSGGSTSSSASGTAVSAGGRPSDPKVVRRWGQSRIGPAASVNRFAAHVSLFFYPLLRQADQQLGTFSLLTGDPILLAKLIDTLGMFILFTGTAPIVADLGKTLVEFLLFTRTHQEAAIRRATLMSLSRVLLSYPPALFLADFSPYLSDLVEWLAATVAADPDQEGRRLAQFAMANLERLVGSPMQAMRADVERQQQQQLKRPENQALKFL